MTGRSKSLWEDECEIVIEGFEDGVLNYRQAFNALRQRGWDPSDIDETLAARSTTRQEPPQ